MKYTHPEIERRWLVDLSEIDLSEAPFVRIEDIYFPETRLRLRKMTDSLDNSTFKFCRKYGKTSDISEPITNLYLSEVEYELLSQLPGSVVVKRRYKIAEGSLDLFETPEDALAIFEKEFASEAEARSYLPPSFTRQEITGDATRTGAALAEPPDRLGR